MAKGIPRGGVTENKSLLLAYSGGGVDAGDIIVNNGQVLIACNKALVNVETSFIYKGPVSLPKLAALVVAPGDVVYYDTTLHTARSSEFYASAAVANAGNTGTGNVGSLVVDTQAVAETWTLTCKSGATTFSVAGSISGAKADATIGVAYDNTFLNFTIHQGTGDGAANFIQGDIFTIAVTGSTKAGIAKEAAVAADTHILAKLGENR